MHNQWNYATCPVPITKTQIIEKTKAINNPQKATSPIEMFHNENYLGDPQNTEFKRTIFKMIKNLCNLKRSQKHEWT